MGLDVYLYHSPDRELAKAKETECGKRVEQEWEKVGGYNASTDAQKQAVKDAEAAIAIELDCTGKYNSHSSVTQFESDSAIYPKHMYKIGYLRSSYNESGINRVLKTLGIPDLYDIFQPGDRYEFTPDWKNSLEICDAAIDAYERHLASATGNISISKVMANMFTNPAELPTDENAALEIVKREVESWATRKSKDNTPGFNWYSNKDGYFYLGKPMEVVAIIPGTTGSILGKLHGRTNALEMCTYVAYRKTKDEGEDESAEDWYLTALKITREMIEFVLAEPDPENFYLGWSA